MRFVVDMNCDNAAFEQQPGVEVANILRQVANSVFSEPEFDPNSYYPLTDSNGNQVGRALWKK